MHATRMDMDMGIKGLGAPGGPGGHQSERSIHGHCQGMWLPNMALPKTT